MVTDINNVQNRHKNYLTPITIFAHIVSCLLDALST